MPKERYKFISAVHLFLFRERQVLLMRRFNTGYKDGQYSVPAGHIDKGESAMSAMIREAKEEVGIDITKNNLKVIHVMHRDEGDDERIDFFMSADKWEGKPQICETDKCDEMAWYDMDNVPDLMIPYVRSALQHIQRNELYSEFGWIRKA